MREDRGARLQRLLLIKLDLLLLARIAHNLVRELLAKVVSILFLDFLSVRRQLELLSVPHQVTLEALVADPAQLG